MKICKLPQEKWEPGFDYPFHAKINPVKFNNKLVVGYSTIRTRSTRTGATLANKINKLLVYKVLKNEKLSKNIFYDEISQLELLQFMKLFEKQDDYQVYQDIQKKVAEYLSRDYSDWRTLPDSIGHYLNEPQWEHYYNVCATKQYQDREDKEIAINKWLEFLSNFNKDEDLTPIFDRLMKECPKKLDHPEAEKLIAGKQKQIRQLELYIQNAVMEDLHFERDEIEKYRKEIYQLEKFVKS